MSNKFEFHYKSLSQEEKREIESIKNQYLEKEISEIDRLKYLDRKVRNMPTFFAYFIGVIGVLVFGLGLTFVLEWDSIVIGSAISIVGFCISFFSYPLYKKLVIIYKNRYREEIINLSNKILENSEEI